MKVTRCGYGGGSLFVQMEKDDQPKPATGEWTNKMVTDFIGHNVNSRDLVRLVDAINAAIAAERERFMQAYRDATDAALAKIGGK